MADDRPTPPVGWYPDPSGAPVQRYWDGTAWTGQEAPRATTPPPSSARNGLGIAALILGIIGAISGLIPLFFWLAGILGVIGLILCFAGRGRAKRGDATNGTMALWGIITSAVALVLFIVGVVIVVGAFEDLGEDVSGTGTSAEEPAASEDPAPQDVEPVPQEVEQEPPRIGEEARDGDFTFVVTAVEDGPPIIGTDEFGTEPQGKFVFVTMRVTNHGDSPGSFLGDNQYLIDTEGRKAGADTEAAFYLSEDAQSLYEEINPGNSLTGIVVFDIPADATPASLELHDSAFSRGVTVTLE
jgi:Domain of unknown function (DUF4352)/Protein of unknown function (DUF2510)